MDSKRADQVAPSGADAPAARTRSVRAGLVGRGIGLSRTPAMHESEGAANGLDYRYDLIDLDSPGQEEATLAAVLDRAEAAGFAGLNITFPFKIEVMAHLDALSRNAETVGAVNTVVFRDGRRTGHNTDLWGFAEGMRTGMPEADLAAVLLVGAGGAGYAVAHALMGLGTGMLWLHDTDPSRAADLERALADAYGAARVARLESLTSLPEELTGIVNATPVGMAKLPGTPVPTARLHAGLWVADIVYFPLETELLAAARAAGCRVLPGSGMAVYQAVRAFELFTGIAPDADRMAGTFQSLGP